MNKLNDNAMKDWHCVHSIEEVYQWHRRHTPWWSEEFLKKELIPRYLKMSEDQQYEPLILTEYEKLLLKSR